MPLCLRQTLLGTAAMIALTTGAFAQENSGGIDTENLVYFEDETYEVTQEDWVAEDASDVQLVRKIGYGRTSFVTVTTNNTGVYSSEALVSPHFRYPGIDVQRVSGGGRASLSYWTEDGWTASGQIEAGSFIFLSETPELSIVTGPDGTCVISASFASC